MASTTEPLKRETEDVEESTVAAGADDEDTGAQVAPIVKLQEVAVATGEEDENVLLDLKAKLYRFDKEGNQWKERGAGTVKLLQHKETKKVRLVMRQSKTLKICANHLVLPSISIQEHSGNDKSCVWHAADYADGELKEELFCIRFATVENCKTFKETVQEIAESQAKKSADTDTAADLLEKLTVAENKDEGKKSEEGPVTAEEKSEEGTVTAEQKSEEKAKPENSSD